MPKKRWNPDPPFLPTIQEYLYAYMRKQGIKSEAEAGRQFGYRDSAAFYRRVHGGIAWQPNELEHFCDKLGLAKQQYFELLTLSGYLSKHIDPVVLTTSTGLDTGRTTSGQQLDLLDTAFSNFSYPPALATALIGRERELAALGDLLRNSDARLVTLMGEGGIGKTQLAKQIARDLLSHFANGVRFVGLDAITDHTLVIFAIAQTLGLRAPNHHLLFARLKSYLRDKSLLLVLDNFDQVVAAGPMVAELLASAPQLKVLITSRMMLHLSGEYQFAVPVLSLPDPNRLPPLDLLIHYGAIRLFIARAQAVKTDFALTNRNAHTVVKICHRLDGLPLAIELAAARIKVFAPQALLARLQERFIILTGGSRDLPARQQTLLNTCDWSYQLLDSTEQTLFRGLSVFAGGCTLEAVEAVCNVIGDLKVSALDIVTALIDKSLLRQYTNKDDEPRFIMLETIREYAWKQLVASSEIEMLRQRHADYYLTFIESADLPKQRMYPQDQQLLDTVDAEHDNLRALLTWAFEKGRVEVIARVAGQLWPYWCDTGHVEEGVLWAERALVKKADLTISVRAETLLGAGNLVWLQGNYGVAEIYLTEAVELFQKLGNREYTAYTLTRLASIADDQREFERSETLYATALALFQEVGNAFGIAGILNNLGFLAYEQDDDARAESLFRESLALMGQTYHKYLWGFPLAMLGYIALKQNDYMQASRLFHESIKLTPIKNRFRIVATLIGLAGAAIGQKHPEHGIRLCAAAAALQETTGTPLPPFQRFYYDRSLAAARSQLNESAFVTAWDTGSALTPEQVMTEVLGESV